jgi:hypothetical protein
VWAFELGQQADEIASRLGVPKVRFAPGPLPEFDDSPLPTASLAPTPAEVAQARLLTASITDERLRESVQRAASLGFARERSIPSV